MKFPTSLAKIFGVKKKEKPKTLREMFKVGLLSNEEFLRFTITQKQVSLTKSKKELLEFLKKRKK
jgi:hypothetical protein